MSGEAFAYGLSDDFSHFIENALAKRGFPVSAPEKLAQAVRQLSDFYLSQPGDRTPWAERFAVPATLAYFMPLNHARLLSVFRELERFVPADSISEIWDFGSGLGNTQWVLEDQSWLSPRPFFSDEVACEARAVQAELEVERAGRWRARAPLSPRDRKAGRLAVFSYAFLEMQNELPPLDLFDHLVVLEPSTRDCGRALMTWRQRWLDAGYTALAPCTHNKACPLLVHSPRDWCHQRIAFTPPTWWEALEANLPMKNRTLTYSYLIMSRAELTPKYRGATRVIGDTLREKGKTRQLICRGEAREFLAWLHKHGEPQPIPHGALIPDLGEVEIKSQEVRPQKGSRFLFV